MGHNKHPSEKARVHGERWHYTFKLEDCVDINRGPHSGKGGFVVARKHIPNTKINQYEIELDTDHSLHLFSEKSLSRPKPAYTKGQRITITSENSHWEGRGGTIMGEPKPMDRYRFSYQVKIDKDPRNEWSRSIPLPFLEQSLEPYKDKKQKRNSVEVKVHAKTHA